MQLRGDDMKYDFSKLTDRYHTGSLKWDVADNELPMWVADMDFETAPEIIEALHQRVDHGIFGYNTVSDDYFQSIQNWWIRRHHFTMEKEWLMFCTGVVPAVSSIVRKMTTIGENVLIQSPVYNIFYNSILNNGRHVITSDLVYDGQKYHIDYSDLEKKLSDPQTTLMILCNPHNPIGKIWDRETLKRIGDLCAKYHVLVVSDEIHCDIVASGKEYIPFASVSQTNLMNSITCIAPTKAFNLAGLQTACLCVPNPVLYQKVNRGINTDEVAEPNSFALTATIAAFNKGELWLDELRSYIDENKNIVYQFINDNLPQLHVVESEATYLLWIDCSQVSLDSVDLTQFIRKTTGLYLSDGKEYGENGRTFIRMNIACPKERVDDGLHRLLKAIQLFQQRESILSKLHEFEDIINIELRHQKDAKEILTQYDLQKTDNLQGTFRLSQEEMLMIEAVLKLIESEE